MLYHRVESISVGDELVVVGVEIFGGELRGDTHSGRGGEGTNSRFKKCGSQFISKVYYSTALITV